MGLHSGCECYFYLVYVGVIFTQWFWVILQCLCVIQYGGKPLLTWGLQSCFHLLYNHTQYLSEDHTVFQWVYRLIVGVTFTQCFSYQCRLSVHKVFQAHDKLCYPLSSIIYTPVFSTILSHKHPTVYGCFQTSFQALKQFLLQTGNITLYFITFYYNCFPSMYSFDCYYSSGMTANFKWVTPTSCTYINFFALTTPIWSQKQM